MLTSIHNLCFEQKYEKILEFLSENFHFFFFFFFFEGGGGGGGEGVGGGVNFSVYLNRHNFEMKSQNSAKCLWRSIYSAFDIFQNVFFFFFFFFAISLRGNKFTNFCIVLMQILLP